MSFTNYDKGRPGVFFTFAEIAQERLAPVDGFVAILSTEYAAPATAGNTYLFESRKAAADGLGATSEAYKAVKRAFDGGATRAVVRTLPATPVVADYTAAQDALLTEFFEAVTFDHIPDAASLASMVAWVEEQREENENYTFLVLGGDAARDADPDLGVAAALLHQDEFIVNLVNAPKYADETLTSAQQAAKVAGQLASLSLADSLTYTTEDGAIDVNKRLAPADVKAVLAAGGYAYEFNGAIVRSIRGITTAKTKIRKSLLKQVMVADIKGEVERNWIGKKPNGPNERLALKGVLASYINAYVTAGIVDAAYTIDVVKPAGAADDQLAVTIMVKFVDSMEEVYVSVGFTQ